MAERKQLAVKFFDTKLSSENILFWGIESYNSKSNGNCRGMGKNSSPDKDANLAISLAHQLINKITPILFNIEMLKNSNLNKSDKKRVNAIFEAAISASKILKSIHFSDSYELIA